MSAIIIAISRGPEQDAAQAVAQARDALLSVVPGQWESVAEDAILAAGLVRRGSDQQAGENVYRSPEATVLLDGYFTDSPDPTKDDAQVAAEIYARDGESGLEALAGSFVVALIDHRREKVVVVTDRSGSRPMYAASNDSMLLLSPEPKAVHAVPGLCGDVLPAAVLSMALNSYLLAECSYWRNVQLLGPARTWVATNGDVVCRRYWTPVFAEESAADPRELERAVRTCVSGHLQRFQRAALALSGGVDSRVILAAARNAGLQLDTVTWAYDDPQGESADFAVGRRIAEAAGFPNAQYQLSTLKLAEQASRIVYAADGLCGLLGAFADRESLAEQLAGNYDAVLFGDQCYRGERRVDSPRDALEKVGIRVGPRVSLVRFLMHRDAAAECLADYRRQTDALLDDARDCPTPHDVHDRLYWQVRVPRLLTGPKSLYRIHLEAVSPLLDVPMLELAARLSIEERAEKAFLRDGLRHMDAELAGMSFAEVHSRTRWKHILRDAGPLPKYIVETLLDPLPAFDRWFDRASIEMWLKSRMSEARQYAGPAPRPGGFTTRAGRRARALLANRAFNARVVINLLTLKLWCHHFGP